MKIFSAVDETILLFLRFGYFKTFLYVVCQSSVLSIISCSIESLHLLISLSENSTLQYQNRHAQLVWLYILQSCHSSCYCPRTFVPLLFNTICCQFQCCNISSLFRKCSGMSENLYHK